MVKELLLSNSKEVALVDKDVYDRVKDKRWRKSTDGYVVRYASFTEEESRKKYLHREVLKARKNDIIDHISRDKLDNRKSNLRLVTTSQNGMNRGVNYNSETGFKGSTIERGRYVSKITNEGAIEYIGTFLTAEDAAKAYNVKAEEYFGEYACLNDVNHEGFDIEKERTKSHGKYRGVCYHKRDKKWQASRSHKGKKHYIGQYDCKIEAAKAYDNYIVNELGITSDVNFPEGRTII